MFHCDGGGQLFYASCTLRTIGVGAMGQEMARHLVNKGFEVVVYDLQTDLIQRAIANGAKGATSIKELAAATECSIVMVATDAQVEDVVQGDDGILANTTIPTLFIIPVIPILFCLHGLNDLVNSDRINSFT